MRCPHATWDPLGEQTALRMSRHDIVCLHTMAGNFNGTDAMFHENGFKGTESHFGIRGDGFAKQWQDTDFRADANYEGNHRVISIETADRGESFPAWSGSDVPPWTAKQLDKIVEIVRWSCDTYGIPKVLVPDSSGTRRGIAYHRQGIDGNFGQPYPGRQGVGERWSTTTGKPCPGNARIRQLIDIVIPRVRGEEDDVDEATLRRVVKEELANARLGYGQVAAQLTHEEVNEGFTQSGSVIRTTLLEMSKRGVNESLAVAPGDASRGKLDERLDAIEAKLTEIGEAVTPPAPPTG